METKSALVDYDDEATIYKVPLHNRKRQVVAYAYVDLADKENVSKHRWCRADEYAHTILKIDGRRVTRKMHHFIIGKPPQGQMVDHINHISSDNRRSNLRFVTSSINAQNKKKKINAISKYIGVSRYRTSWTAQYSSKHLGSFKTEQEAAYSYDLYVKKLFDNPQLNNVSEPENFKMWQPNEKNGSNCLPPGVVKTKYNTFRVHLECFKKVIHNQTYKTLQEALDAHAKYSTDIVQIRQQHKIDQMNKPIVRDENGIAILQFGKDNVQVDDDIYMEYISHARHVNNKYPCVVIDGNQKRLHQLLLPNPPENSVVDHLDMNTLNAQRSNLRYVDISTNSHNCKKTKDASSIYFGVSLGKGKYSKYRVAMFKDGVMFNGGSYDNEQVAAFAADELASQLYGANAKRNNVNLAGYVFVNNRAIKIEDLEFGNGTECTKNKKLKKNNTSRFFGVHKVNCGSFGVRIQQDKVRHSAGQYKSEQVAAWASDQLVLKLYGQNAHINNIKLEGYAFINNRAVKIEDVENAQKTKKRKAC